MKTICLVSAALAVLLAGNSSFAGTFTAVEDLFVRAKGTPVYDTVPFSVHNPSASFVIKVKNGPPGYSRISSGDVWVNGTQMFFDSDFNQQVDTLQKNVSLQKNNQLVVWLASKPGAAILVNIVGTDNQSPTISIISPANGSFTNNPTPVISVQYGDALSGVMLDSLRILINGVNRTSYFTKDTGSATWAVPSQFAFSQGVDTIRASIYDLAGNSTTAQSCFTVLLTPPTVMITSPVNGFLTNHSPIAVAWTVNGVAQTTQLTQALNEGLDTIIRTATDAAGNVGSASVIGSMDTVHPVVAITSPANGFLTNQTPISVAWTVNGVVQTTQLSQALVEGPNTITRSFASAAGNTGTASVTGTLDTVHPVVAITSPPNGFLTNQTPIAVAWTVNGVAQTMQLTQALVEGSNTITRSFTSAAGNTGTASITVILDTHVPVVVITSPSNGFITNQTSISVAWTVDGVTQTTQLTQTLVEGPNTITRSFTSAAGNTGTVSITGTLDTHVPVVVITSPANGFLTNQTSISVAWTIDGVAQTTQLTQPLVEGPNTITRSFTSAAGNTGTASITVTLKTHPPVVKITSPVNGFLTNNPIMTVAWTVDGAQQTTQVSETLKVEGINAIVRSAVDAAGNVGSDTVKGTLDTIPPQVKITRPSHDTIVNTPSFLVGYMVDGTALTKVISLSEGPNKIVIDSTDPAGNRGADSVMITLDTVPPIVKIVFPQQGFITNNPIVLVSWTVDSVRQTTQVIETLHVEGVNTIVRFTTDSAGNVGSDTVRGTLKTRPPVVHITSPANAFLTNNPTLTVAWTVDGVQQTTQLTQSLVEGDNMVIRAATDVAGNTGADTIHVTLKTHPPVVVITSPVNGFWTNQTPIAVAWTVDGTTQTTQLSENLVEGVDTITRTFTDAAGNTGSASITVTLDTHPPVVKISSPANGFVTAQATVAVIWTVDGVQQTTQTQQNLSVGQNLIIRTATDSAGNVGADTVTVTRNVTPPVVRITFPADSAVVHSSPVSIFWQVDGVEQTTQTSQAMNPGYNAIIRSATNEAGLVGADTIVVYYENNGHLVQITSPTDGFTSASAQITFTVQALTSDLASGMFLVDGTDQTGNFANQNKVYSATFTEADGHHTFIVYSANSLGRKDTARVTFNVNTTPPQTQVTISGMVVDGKTFNPLSGASVKVNETGSAVTTGADGKFILPSGGFGKFAMRIEYPGYTFAMRNVIADSGADVSFSPIQIIPQDTHSVVVQARTAATIALCDSQLQLAIPNTALSTNTPISATMYNHISQIPNEQPTYDIFLFCVDLQPTGTVFNDSITVRVANKNELSVGAEVPITLLNEQTANWDDIGTGRVTQDGKFIEYKVKHFCPEHGNMHTCETQRCDINNDKSHTPQPPGPCPTCCPVQNSPHKSGISYQSGNLSEDFNISGGSALTNIDVNLVYNSSSAFPAVLLSSTFKDFLIVPSYNVWKLYLPGLKKQWLFYGIANQTQVGYVWNGTDETGKGFQTGLYSFGIRKTDIYMPGRYRYDMGTAENLNVDFSTATTINSYYYGFIPLVNRTHSPYGAGWAINGITRIITKKGDFTGPFPQKYAYRGIDSKTGTVSPESDSVAGVDFATAIGTTRGSLTGGHVYILDGNPKDDIYWYQDGTNVYLPPYGSHDTLMQVGSGWVRKMADGTIENYDGRGLLTDRTDKKGHKTTFAYDDFGERLLRISDVSTGRYTELFYDNHDMLSVIRDQFGRVTNVSIDQRGDLVAIQTPDGVVANRFDYDSTHCLVHKFLPSGEMTTHYYDKWGKIIKVESTAGDRTVYQRFTSNNIVNEMDPVSPDALETFGLSTGSVKDYSSQPVHSLSPIDQFAFSKNDQSGDSVSYKMNSFGWVSSMSDAKGNQTSYTYDIKVCGCGSATGIQYPNGLSIAKTYDAHGNLLTTKNSVTGATSSYSYTSISGTDYVDTITNALGQKTVFQYDSIGNMTKTIAPGGDTTAITYNNLSLPESIRDPLGRTVRTRYDSLGRVTARINPTGDSTRYSYDNFGNLACVVDPMGRSTSYAYDIMGRLLRETDPAGNVTRYAYDNSGRLDTLFDPKNHRTTFVYDSAGNLVRSTNHLGISRYYTYDPQGKLSTYTNARGQTISYQYDELKRLVSKADPAGNALARFGYDNIGNMVYAANNGYTINRIYDAAGRMTQEDERTYKTNDTLTSPDTLKADDFSLDNTNLVLNGTTTVVDGEHNFLSVRLMNGAILKHLPTDAGTVHTLTLIARDSIVIDATSKIDLTGLGYLGGGRGNNDTTVGRTNGNSVSGGSTPGSGGSHGGRGGAYVGFGRVIGVAAFAYDNRLWPTQPGGGGGSNGNPGFNGGGVVYVKAPKILVDGSIIADGEKATNQNGGAGAGGSIIVQADTLFGNGFLRANGGDGMLGDEMPMGGGGGRIFVSGALQGNVYWQVVGGLNGGIDGSSVIYGPSGYEVKQISISGGVLNRIDRDYDALDGSILFVDGSTVVINGEHSFQQVSLRNGSVLTHDIPKDSSDVGALLHILGGMYLDSTSKIDVSGKGYAGGTNSVCARTQRFECGATGNSGGSYGNLGGRVGGDVGTIYGVVKDPSDFGSGGAGDSASQGGAGGGRIEVISPSAVFDGYILSDGLSSKNGGGGSGGSIELIVDSISGKGRISANGGGSMNGGGGSGGRVSILSGNFGLISIDNIRSDGGLGIAFGGPGTVYLGNRDSLIQRPYAPISVDSIITLNNGSLVIGSWQNNYDGLNIVANHSVVKINGNHVFNSITLNNSSAQLTDSIFVRGNVSLANNSVVSHQQTTIAQAYALRMFVGGIVSIDSTSAIDVSACGYMGDQLVNGAWCGARTLNNAIGSSSGSQHWAGGSYGGLGAQWSYCYNQYCYSSAGTPTPTYGSFFSPNELGSGGGADEGNAGWYGGSGGGFVRIDARKLSIAGKILSDGGIPGIPTGGGGGSGGGIYLAADTVAGKGKIEANGGPCTAYYGGGGGGRIAVYAGYISDTLDIHSLGSSTGGNGTVFLGRESAQGIALSVINSGRADSTYSITSVLGANDTLFEGRNISVSGSGLEIQGTHRFGSIQLVDASFKSNGNLTIDSMDAKSSYCKMTGTVTCGGSMRLHDTTVVLHEATTLTQENRLALTIGNELVVDSSSRVDVSACGYLGDQIINGSSCGARTLNNAVGSVWAGGSYGGLGSQYQDGYGYWYGTVCPAYGSFYAPGELGSGGGSNGSSGNAGGNGGGFVSVNARKITVSGNILSNGGGGISYGGGGSGGGLYLVADTVAGRGKIQANGGAMWVNWGGHAGGGGGRIAVYGVYISDSLDIRSLGSPYGTNGSVFLSRQTQQGQTISVINPVRADSTYPITSVLGPTDTLFEGRNIFLSGGGLQIQGNHRFGSIQLVDASFKSNGNLTIDSMDAKSSYCKMTGMVTCGGSMRLHDTTAVLHEATTLTQENRLALTIGNELVIDSSSRVDVSACGYLGDQVINGTRCGGRTLGNAPGSVYAGGSYGGQGCVYIDGYGYGYGSTCPIYGDFYRPNELGSGGGSNGSGANYGGNGGGFVSINARKITNAGKILSNGGGGSGYGGGGSGGAIYIVADTVAGRGKIQANGGPMGSVGWGGHAAGGGGRIAIYGTLADSLTITAYAVTTYAGAGTVFLRDSVTHPLGLLKCDNNGINASANTTQLIAIAAGHVTAMTPDTLTDANAAFSPFVKGHLVKLNFDYQNTNGAFTVTGVATHSLKVDTTNGNLFTKGKVGDPYIGVYAFDTIVVKGGAKVQTSGMVFYRVIQLSNGQFTSYSGTQTGMIEKRGDIPDDVRMSTVWRKVLREKVPVNDNNDMRIAAAKAVWQKVRVDRMARLTMAFLKPVQEKQALNVAVVKAEKKPGLFVKIGDFFKKLFVSNAGRKDKAQAKAAITKQADTTVSMMMKKIEVKPVQVASAGVPDIAMAQNVKAAPAKEVCKNADPSYTYDVLDRVTSMASPAGTTTYQYDSITGRLASITSPEGKTFTYSYNHGQLASMQYPNGITASYTFDDNGNLTMLDYKKGGSTVRSYGYTYDKNGMRTSMTDVDGTHNYSYDSLYQIVQATHPTAPNPLEQFSYDAVGNRMTDLTHSAYQYNEVNELLEDDSCLYQYDLDGNMVQQVNKNTGDTTTFTYDIENKLVRVQKPGMVAKYAYDALGQRMAKTVNGTAKHFRYDGDNLVLEMNGQDSIVADYTFGPGIDNPLTMNRNGQNYFYVKDGLGSGTALTDDAGDVKNEYKYSVFGKIIEENGDTIENPFTYASRELDKETEDYYYRARYFYPSRGRFLQEDPLGVFSGDDNLFRYVFNNSLNNIDPSGMWCIPIWYDKQFLYNIRFIRYEYRTSSWGFGVAAPQVNPPGQNSGIIGNLSNVNKWKVSWAKFRITITKLCWETKCTNSCPPKCKTGFYKETESNLVEGEHYELEDYRWMPY